MEDASGNNLAELAELIGKRNEIEKRMSKIIDRPAEKGNIFEYIASHLFPLSSTELRSIFPASDTDVVIF